MNNNKTPQAGPSDVEQSNAGAAVSDSQHLSEETSQTRTRTYNWRALVDALIVIVVLVAVKQFFLQYTIKYAGPISTFTAMIVATWRLRTAGMTWADLGFRRPDSMLKTGLMSLGVLAAIIAAGVIGSGVADLSFDKAYVANRFGDIEGDIPMFALWLFLIWTHGSFFEEMLFRAFIINSFERFVGAGTWATVLSVTLAAVFFGYRHAYYQGPYGFIVTGVIGLALGFIYVWIGRRNLWPQILAHGYMNTIGFTMRFLGLRS